MLVLIPEIPAPGVIGLPSKSHWNEYGGEPTGLTENVTDPPGQPRAFCGTVCPAFTDVFTLTVTAFEHGPTPHCPALVCAVYVVVVVGKS